MILRRHAAMGWTGSFWLKHEPASGAERMPFVPGDRQVRGFFDRVVVCFAHGNFAQDDGARHATEDGYRFLAEFRVGATMGLLTGTIAPFDGSAAALALVITSS